MSLQKPTFSLANPCITLHDSKLSYLLTWDQNMVKLWLYS